jgi:inosine-uridine nucleoside N-ribohydrolase
MRLPFTKVQVARVGLFLAAAALALVVAAGSARAAVRPPAYVANTDGDFDAVAALAYLGEAARNGRIDLRAVTVEISGFDAAGTGLSYARCELAKLGLSNVPSSDGDLAGVNPFPDFRTFIDPIIERAVRPDPATLCPSVPREGGAAQLLVSAILSAPGRVTVVNSGPLTNLAEALRLQPLIRLKIGRLYAMGGGIAHGNVSEPGFDGSQEYNFWADPPAARAVFRALSGRVFMTGLDATDHVPLSADFRLRLAADLTTPAANVVYSMASDPLFVGQEGLGTLYWWDALNAVASTTGGAVSYRLLPIDVVQSGPSSGRTVVSLRSAQLVHVGLDADTARWTDKMIAGLNGSH